MRVSPSPDTSTLKSTPGMCWLRPLSSPSRACRRLSTLLSCSRSAKASARAAARAGAASSSGNGRADCMQAEERGAACLTSRETPWKRRTITDMATKKSKGLGMGLEALLGPKVSDTPPGTASGDGTPSSLRLDLMQPGKYQRRPRAAKLAGLTEVPVLVKDVPDEAAAAMALIENIQREDLNPLEEAQGLQRLTAEFGLTHEQAAQAVGRSRSAASNLLRLLNLAEPVQSMLMAGDLDMGHARALLPLDKAVQITTANEVVARKLNVRETEKLVAKTQGQGRQTPLLRVKSEKTRDVLRLEEELSDLLTAQVSIHIRRKTLRGEQGELTIAFGSLDELDGLIDKLRRAGGGEAA